MRTLTRAGGAASSLDRERLFNQPQLRGGTNSNAMPPSCSATWL